MADTRIDKGGFLSSFPETYSEEACKKKHGFRRCFAHISIAQCHKFVKTIGKTCGNKLAGLYPKRIIYKQVMELADQISLCVKMAYIDGLSRNKPKTRTCLAKNWDN